MAPRDFAFAAELHLATDTAPLGWWRVRHSGLAGTTEAARLRETYRISTLRAVFHQQALQDLVTRLRRGGVEPVLVKGWAIARLYPHSGLRGYMDHDVCVRRSDYPRARGILGASTAVAPVVDLHDGFATLDESCEEDLFARSVVVDCGGTPVRVLSPEDHLRVLCRHLLRHGAARPLWLCDVAAAVEARGPDFDWARCLGPRRRVARWVAGTLDVAHQLLGMSLEGTPLEGPRPPLPAWLVPTVLEAWGQGPKTLARVADSLQRPAQIIAEVRRHWPNGLQATFVVRGPLNQAPRLPFQVAACVPGAMRVATDTVQRWRAYFTLRSPSA